MSTEEAYLSEAHHAVSDAALDTLFRESPHHAQMAGQEGQPGAVDGDL